jgi:hypothetical protein
MPPWLYVAMIAVPLAGIAVLAAMRLGRDEEPEAPVQVAAQTVDPNVRIQELSDRARALQADFKKLPLRSEDPTERQKLEDFRQRLLKWREDWNEVFKDKLDAEGNLPPEYRGYLGPRNQMNQLLSDLNREIGF